MAVVLVSIGKLTMVVILFMVYCTTVLPKWKIVQETGIAESNTIVTLKNEMSGKTIDILNDDHILLQEYVDKMLVL
jgi:hypothetical protein